MYKTARYRERKRGEDPDMRGCVGCRYYSATRDNRCGYYTEEGKLRLTSPEDCEVKVKRKK